MMLLRKSFLCLCLLGSLSTAQAATSANVTINGKIISSTCNIDVNGSSDAVITLRDVMTSEFTSTGGVSSTETPFAINLSACNDVSADTLQIKLTRTGAANWTNSLPNTGSAKNVEFTLQKQNGSSWVTTPFTAGQVHLMDAPVLNGGKATVNMKVRYAAISLPVTTGTVSSTMKVDLDYK